VFISVEGIEGAGKSTQVELLRAELESLGRPVVVTREPGGTEFGERVRALLLGTDTAVAPQAEALLFAAARAQLVAEVIRPALARGADVLSDRFVHSSLAYQGVARGLGYEQVESVNRWATGGVWPDLVVLLNLDAKLGLDRAQGTDRFEAQELPFHEAVARSFLELAGRDPAHFVVVDADAPVDQVAARVRAAVLPRLGVA
jgi:dTMP kinase